MLFAGGGDEVGVVEEPVDGGVGDRLGHELVEPRRVEVGGDGDAALLVGGDHDPVEGFGGVGGNWEQPDVIDFASLDHTGAQRFFRLIAAACERRALGIGSHWPFEDWGRFLPEHTTAVSHLDHLLHHAVVVVTEGGSHPMKQARSRGGRPSTTKP